MSLARIAFTFDAGTHAVLSAMLDSEGLATVDLSRGSHVAIAGVDQGYYLHVLEDDRIRAVRLLRERGFEKYLITEDDQA